MLTLADELPTCGLHGHQLNFSVTVLQIMGESLATKAIIHELGHASLCAEHDSDHWALVPYEDTARKANRNIVEKKVDDRLRSWGIDQSDLLERVRAWEDDHPAPLPDSSSERDRGTIRVTTPQGVPDVT